MLESVIITICLLIAPKLDAHKREIVFFALVVVVFCSFFLPRFRLFVVCFSKLQREKNVGKKLCAKF